MHAQLHAINHTDTTYTCQRERIEIEEGDSKKGEGAEAEGGGETTPNCPKVGSFEPVYPVSGVKDISILFTIPLHF